VAGGERVREWRKVGAAWAAKDLLETIQRMKRVEGFANSRWVSVFVRRKR